MTFLDISNRLAVKHKKTHFAARWRHLPKRLKAYIIELPQLVGVCIMTFFDISNHLAVKYKKRISRLDGATYQKKYRPTL